MGFRILFFSADGGIPTGGFAAFQVALLRNDPPDRPFRPCRRSGSNPFMYTKMGCLMASHFCVRRRRDSNPRAPEGKRISSAPRYDHFDTSADVLFATLIILIDFNYFVNTISAYKKGLP